MKKKTLTGSVTLTGALAVCACVLLASPALADGIQFPLDLTTDESELFLGSENSNDAYDFAGRGIIFRADEAIEINGAALWTKSTTGLNATFDLWQVEETKSDELFDTATLLRSGSNLLIGDLGFHGAKFEPITLTPLENYLILVSYEEAADENWYFDFTQPVDPPLDLGPVTVIDGTAGESTDSAVAPFMALQIVPSPAPLLVIAAVALVSRRRRRL